MASSCNDNKKNNLRIKQLENNLKKIKNENKSKDNKIQSLMDELSVCKESKIKYVEKNDNNYQVINDNGMVDTHRNVETNGNTSLPGNATIVREIKKEINFASPEDIIGECKKSDINRVFHNLTPYFKKCFEINNIKKGKIGFTWIINESGAVVKVLSKKNVFNKKLSLCLTSVIEKGRYNSPESGICTVTYVFKL